MIPTVVASTRSEGDAYAAMTSRIGQMGYTEFYDKISSGRFLHFEVGG